VFCPPFPQLIIIVEEVKNKIVIKIDCFFIFCIFLIRLNYFFSSLNSGSSTNVLEKALACGLALQLF